MMEHKLKMLDNRGSIYHSFEVNEAEGRDSLQGMMAS